MQIHHTPAEAVACVQSNQRVFIHGQMATPLRLIEGLLHHAGRLRHVELMHLHTDGPARYADAEFRESFRVANLFVGSNIRHRVDHARVDYIPCFLSEMPLMLKSGARPVDVALVNVSPPDVHGFCTLGPSVDVAHAAVDTAKIVVAQINRQVPRVHGDGFVHISRITHAIEVDEPLPEMPRRPFGAIEAAIGKHVAGLIEDGACLQMGIGAVPDAVLSALKDRRHLGIHTEMWSDGALELIQAGAVDNSRKEVHPGKTVASFVSGTQRCLDFLHDNPSAILLGIDYVNRTDVICRNKNMVAINSAVEIDLTGQVCADSVGHRVISGVGGQMDFIRGAALSPGGKPVIAITSRSAKGTPRIVPTLKFGAGVVTTRAHVHYVATEYGVVNLFGKTLAERATALIGLAHPDDREMLERQWHAVRAVGAE